MFQRSLLDWLLFIWTLSPVCEIHDKMQVVYKELTYRRVKSKVTKSELICQKCQNMGELQGKFTGNSI